MNNKIGNISNYLAALILLSMGIIYLFKNSFMPYHSDAVSMPWNELDSSFQYLILALMRTVAGGFMAAAVAIIVLQRKYTLNKISWIPLLILIYGLCVSFASIYATIIVRLHTPGKPPTALAIAGTMLLILGYIFNQKTLKKN